jgi:hypothetical protein
MAFNELFCFAHRPAGDFYPKVGLIEEIPDQRPGNQTCAQDQDFFHV